MGSTDGNLGDQTGLTAYADPDRYALVCQSKQSAAARLCSN
jgi:hypothetical protein